LALCQAPKDASGLALTSSIEAACAFLETVAIGAAHEVLLIRPFEMAAFHSASRLRSRSMIAYRQWVSSWAWPWPRAR
jgi:hypothetical protein